VASKITHIFNRFVAPFGKGLFYAIIFLLVCSKMELNRKTQVHHHETRVDYICHTPMYQGIGNKIKGIVSAKRLVGCNRVFWSELDKAVFPTKNVNYYFPDLEEVDTMDGSYWRGSWRMGLKPGDIPIGFAKTDKYWWHYMNEPVFPIPHQGLAIDMEYNRIPEPLKSEYSRIFSELRIADHILEVVDKASNNFDGDTVSVHIRTWNTQTQDEDFKRHKKLFSMESYLAELDKYSDRKFYVATDDQNVIKTLKERYGDNRILTHTTGKPYLDTIVDLLLLAKSDKMVLTPFSTFSEVAWWLGGAKADVAIAWKGTPPNF